MKKNFFIYLIYLLSLFVFPTRAMAEEKNDIIVTTKSERIDATVLEVSETEIRYKKASNPTGPTFVISTEKIASILYKNGEVQVFSGKTTSSSKSSTKTPTNDNAVTSPTNNTTSSPEEQCENLYLVTSKGNLNVRKAASSEATVIGTVKSGDTITVINTTEKWAEIQYGSRNGFVSMSHIKQLPPIENVVIHTTVDSIDTPASSYAFTDSTTDELPVITNKKIKQKTFPENWGIDFLPDAYIGASDFIGDYMPRAHLGLGFDFIFQFYQKRNGQPKGWIASTSMGYALKGGGGLVINQFTFIISPAGYVHTFKKDVTFSALLGMSLNFGGGSLYAYRKGQSKTFDASPCDAGLQLKLATEWHNYGWAVAYDQGFIDAVSNSNMRLKNFGFNFHFYYRLWNLTNNTIHK